MRSRLVLASSAAVALLLASITARADDVLHLGAATLDRPTVITLGVRWALTGDDNFNASVAVQYRKTGTSAWSDGLPLYRVHAELVTGGTATPEFAGSVFDLAPGTSYDIQLSAHDPDGGDMTTMLTAATRPVPATDPQNPRVVQVSTAGALQNALDAAQPGDVITLAAGTYDGEFTLNASGTAADPIVIRGVDRDTVILDGGNIGSNVLAIEGSFTHVEDLTLQHDTRALRFHGSPASDNVVRRVHAKNVVLGFGSNPQQQDFYLCDNVLEGRLSWPQVYSDDGGAHANDDGIHVEGDGHVVCHNTLSGFGDAMKVETVGARAVDFYGNDVDGSYDNAVELDQSQGNTRAFRNRFTNTYMPLSFQPIFGGPAYAIRNLVINAAVEQVKIHNATVGPVILNNTFMSAAYAFQVLDDTTAHAVTMTNNLWIGPATPMGGRSVNWDQPVDPATDVLDFDGFYPDGQFHMGFGATGANFASFAAMQAGGVYEGHGRLVDGPSLFESGLVTPPSYTVQMPPPDCVLADGSNAIDQGVVLPNVTDGFVGAAPDLGALERGCPSPVFGVRPDGVDEHNETFGCPSNGSGGGATTGAGGGGPGAGGAATSGATTGAGASSSHGAGTGANNGSGGGANSGAGGGAAEAGDGGDAGASGGCGCGVAGEIDSRAGTTALAALLLVLAGRRRRASPIRT